MTEEQRIFHELKPGIKLPNDWYNGAIPLNIETGEEVMIDSSFCFKHFFSTLPIGMRLGNKITLWRTSLAVEENGFLEVGDYCYIANASIVCSQKISIGNRVFIAGGVTIADSDFHPLDPASRLADIIALSPIGNRNHRPAIKSLPVVIEDDVWIGFNATILKGVHIGAGAVIYPGSLVIENIPAGAIVSGNPAKPVNLLT
jgi:acetyltransferase-like isoleucine patch superfamily enzyme